MEQILSADELSAIAVFERLDQNAAGQAGLAHAAFADEDDVLRFADEMEFSERPDLSAVDAGLLAVGEGLQSPKFR